MLHKTYGFGTSEFRERMFLARALDAKGMTAAARAELNAARALAGRLTLGPEWLTALGRVEARAGRVREARQMLALAEKASGNTLTDSSVNRNLQQDDVQIMGLKGEIARADGKFTEAITLLQAVGNGPGHYAIYSLASALQGAGRLEGAAREYQRLLDRRPLGDEAQEDWLAAHVRLGEIFERLNRPPLPGSNMRSCSRSGGR